MTHKEIHHENTCEAVCPWCGTELSDSFELADEEEIECSECDKKFDVYRNVEVTYSTVRSKCEKCNYILGSHKANGEPYNYNGKCFCIWKCTICHHKIIKTGPIKSEPYIIQIDEDVKTNT